MPCSRSSSSKNKICLHPSFSTPASHLIFFVAASPSSRALSFLCGRWWPDSSKLVIYSNVRGTCKVWSVEADDVLQQLSRTFCSKQSQCCAISPDGNFAVIGAAPAGYYQILCMPGAVPELHVLHKGTNDTSQQPKPITCELQGCSSFQGTCAFGGWWGCTVVNMCTRA